MMTAEKKKRFGIGLTNFLISSINKTCALTLIFVRKPSSLITATASCSGRIYEFHQLHK